MCLSRRLEYPQLIQQITPPEPASHAMIVHDVSIEATKQARIMSGAKPRTVDLFSGCGGMSLGFQRAGFELAGALENDAVAFESHKKNLGCLTRRPLDINATQPSRFAEEIGLEHLALGVDVIIGGPPCQAFARVGRSKLREIAAHPEAFRHDERASLYLRLLAYVDAFRPVVVVLENVPDFINFGGTNVAQEISYALVERGFSVEYALLNSAFYGVPQMRERVFLVATHRSAQRGYHWPPATHFCELPRGYEGSRQVALKLVRDDPNAAPHFRQITNPGTRLPAAVTARQALADLPALYDHLRGMSKRGARRFHDLMPYRSDVTPSAFAKSMQLWPGFESRIGVIDHVIRHLPRDYRLFQIMNEGDQYPEAHSKAFAYFTELAKRAGFREKTQAYDRLLHAMVPPYDPAKFPNKWRKMEADQPARTLMAHLGKDGYSHIHYDSAQGRTISVREAARLQSFPDGFRFAGTMNPAFRQIGNAVPPLLATAVAEQVMIALKDGR